MWSHKGFRWEKINREINLHFITAGRGIVQIDDKKFDAGAGDIFILYPHTDTCYWDLPGSRWRYDWVTMAMPVPYTALQLAGFSEANPVRTIPLEDKIWTHIKKLRLTFRSGRFSRLYPANAAWQLLDLLAQTTLPQPDSFAEQIRNYIDVAEVLPEVKEIALHFGVARSTVYRAFAAAYRQPVKKYLDQVRFENAAELLRDTGFNVARIAETCGFSSPQYFCRAFHARFGTSPAAWRRSQTET